MKGIDYIFIILFIGSIIYGYRKGLLKQLGCVAAIIGGIVVSRLFCNDLGRWLETQQMFNDSLSGAPEFLRNYAASVTAALILFFAGYLTVRILFSFVDTIFKTLPFSVLNRLCGAVVCVFINFLLLSAFLNFCQMFKTDGPVIGQSALFEGKLATGVMDLAPSVFGCVKYAFIQSNNP